MLVHLFGAKSSPCSQKNTAREHQSQFNVPTIDMVSRNFHFDDCQKSFATVPEATSLIGQLTFFLSKGMFHLTKWVSNYREVLESIPATEWASSLMSLDFEDLPIDRALGT